MEIQVDVHTVHPMAAPTNRAGPGSSWGTPDSTPTHNVLSKTRSNIENKTLQDGTRQREDILSQMHKIRLLAASPPSDYSSDDDIRDDDTELNDFPPQSEPESEDESIEDSPEESPEEHSPPEERPPPVAEIPQNPVPTSPARAQRCKGLLRFSFFCDPFMPIDPQGRAYITWLLLVTCCYSYNAWCIALRASFPYQTPENTPYWMTVDYICDLVYILDVAMVKPRLMFLHEGFWVNDLNETRKNYRKKLQYKFDLLSLLPLDILYFYFGPQRVILRLPRLLKLQSFWEFHQAMDRVLSSPYVVRVGKMLFYIFYLIHLNACAYYAMSDYIGLGKNGWVYDNKGSAYIRCFYFATKTATSIGKNPKPEDTIEYLFMTVAWLMGVFVFALLIGQIRDIFATATRARAEYRKKLDGCTRYLRRLNMPTSLQRRVTLWFNYTWRKQRCFDEAKILNSLPFNMKRDVALAVHMSTLSKVQLFRDCSSSLLRDLVLQLRPVSFLPGDLVVRSGEVGHQMYIIASGECWVMSPDETEVLATLKEGSVFGEISLLGIDGLRRRTATVRSRGYSSLFALSKSDLDYALGHHKEAARVLRLRADQIIRENAARMATQRMKLEAMEAKLQSLHEVSEAATRKLAETDNLCSSPVKQQRSPSTLTKRRLSGLSGISKTSSRSSISSACSSARNPLPKIMLSGD